MLALQELLSCRLGRLGRTEEDREPEVLGRIIGKTALDETRILILGVQILLGFQLRGVFSDG